LLDQVGFLPADDHVADMVIHQTLEDARAAR
jgi:hypothetical protein